jgi:hypothetical protein
VPVNGGRVIAGVFKPGFDISTYLSLYDDGLTNPDQDHYDQAVADGNFIPFNSGVLTNASGVFSGVGTSAAIGSQIWLYGWPTSSTISPYSVLASGTDASFRVSASTTTVIAGNANQFWSGQHYLNGFRLEGLPVPEPCAAGLIVVGGSAICSLARRKRRITAV